MLNFYYFPDLIIKLETFIRLACYLHLEQIQNYQLILVQFISQEMLEYKCFLNIFLLLISNLGSCIMKMLIRSQDSTISPSVSLVSASSITCSNNDLTIGYSTSNSASSSKLLALLVALCHIVQIFTTGLS